MRLIFLLVWMLAVPLSGFAQTPEQKAEQLFNEAEKYKKAGSYEKAIERYTEAYVLTDAADLLFNIGQCQKNLKRFDEALKTYKKYLEEVAKTDESLVENFYALDLVRSALPGILESPDFPKGAFYKKLYKEVESLTLTLIKRAEKLPRPSLVTVSGAEGCEVFLDGAKITASLEESKVKVGTHKLMATREGYLDFIKEFTAVESGGRINIKVEQEAIGLTIAGPAGAEVSLNGEMKGQLPLSLSPLKAGSYKVKVMVPGYVVWQQEVTLPGASNPMQLNAEASPIVVSFKGPEGAQLFVDGISQGSLPASIEKLSRGLHKVEVKKDGFETFTKEITVAEDQAAQEIEITLSPVGTKRPEQPTNEKPSGAYKALYGVAGAGAVGGGALLVNSLIARGQVADMLALNDAGLDDLVALRAKQADTLLAASAGLFAVAAGSAVAGVMMSSKAKKETPKASILLTPTQLGVVGRF